MSSRSHKRQRNDKVSGTTPTEYLPPGSPNVVPANVGAGEYPAVTIVDEAEHKEQVAAETEKRVERETMAKGPKRLSQQEMLDMTVLLKYLPEGDDVPLATPIKLEVLPEQMRLSFFDPQVRSLHHRGIVKLLMNPETKQYDALEITEMGFYAYQKQSGKIGPTKQKRATKADGTPRAVGGRASTKFDGLRMRKMADNPRDEGTMGYFSWQLYQDGMTYKEYMNRKDYPESYSKRTNEKFRGPGRNHWEWDLLHGYIALYRDGENETLEDGTPNPNYWVVKNTI